MYKRNMKLPQDHLFAILLFSFFSGWQVNCSHINSTSIFCLLKVNESESCNSLDDLTEYQTEFDLLFNNVPLVLQEKLVLGYLVNFTIEEIIKLPISLLYILPVKKLGELSGAHLASLLIQNEADTPIAYKILLSISTDQQRNEFLNFLASKVIKNDKILDIIGKIVYKWNYDIKDGKFQKLSNICGYVLAKLWAPYVLTRTKPFSTRLLTLLAEAEQKQKLLCNNNNTQVHWKNLPKSIRRLWSLVAVNQSFPSPLNKWTVEQIALQYKFLLPDFNNNELSLIPFDELSKMALHDIDFEKSQARFLFSLLMENSTLKDVKILYPKLFFKLSPLQINQFEPEEWANEKIAISSLRNTDLSYTAAKQIFNKIASYWLVSKANLSNKGWTSDDIRHLPLLYTQPASSFFKFCTVPPSVQSLIAVDSYELTERQAFYLSGCSNILSFYKNDLKILLNLKYIIKAISVSSLLNINTGSITYQVASHLVSSINNHNLPMALHLLNITDPVKQNFFFEEMLKNEHNILFEQLGPMDVPGPVFDILKQLYVNYTDRIDKLPKHILSVILESNELLFKWTGNESAVIKGLYNGYTCNFIKKLNSANFIVSISYFNSYLKRNGKVFPKNLQVCVAQAFINYLKLKTKFTSDSSRLLYLESWEIEAVPGFVLTALPSDVILSSNLRDNLLYTIGQLSYPELMIASKPEKLSLMVNQYIKLILKNGSYLTYEHLYTLGNLFHFLPPIYLNLVDKQAFKYMVESGIFDTRICVDSISKNKWSDLIIKAFGNLEIWSSDTLISLSDLLIVFNQDQLNSIPRESRLNSADIVRTRYVDEIEWIPNNIPFYKCCAVVLGDQFANFTDSLSTLINFHLISMQNQLQMISPIRSNLVHEKIIKSPEIKPNIFKPSVLIPLPAEVNNFNNTIPNKLSNTFFAGKEKPNVIDTTLGSMENTEFKQTTDKFISKFLFSLNISIVTETTNSIFEKNSTNSIFLLSTSDSSKYNQNLKKFPSGHYTERTLVPTFSPLTYSNDKHKRSVVSNFNKPKEVKNNDVFKKQKEHNFLNKIKSSHFIIPGISEYDKYSLNSSLLDLKSKETLFSGNKNYMFNTTKKNSLSSEMFEISTKRLDTFNKNDDKRSKRSYKLFFSSDLQISCEALKMLGPASVTSIQFDSIIQSMSDEELNDCIDLLGSFDINPKLAKYIWSKTKNKDALHTYGSILSGLSINDIKTINFDMNNPWTLELINLFSKYIETENIRKEITKQCTVKSRANIPLHLWSSFGSLICQLQPRTFKIIMPNKELFWKMSSAFNAIKVCNTPCIKNLASIAVSLNGPSNLWKTSEVERMGIIVSGINITQWQMLLNFNPEALEGLSPYAIKCLDKQQIQLMNDSHMNHLTPKSANTLLESHSNFLNFKSKKKLLKLVNFDIQIDWQPLPLLVSSKIFEGHKLKDNDSVNDSIYAYETIESTNNISFNEMQANSKATNHVLSFCFLNAVIILTVFM